MKEFNLPYFIYTGNAYPHKNLEKVIRAIIEINKNSETKIMFLIVSSRNVFTTKLEKLINKLNAKDIVKLLGFVEDKQLNELYRNSIGFIFPSLMEGFGLPGLEAMKAGTILLASDIPVFREIYGNHATYFNPNEIKSIESAMKKTMEISKMDGIRIIKDNKEFVKRYSWEKMARETLQVYNSLK
ncbi:hypothetical protein BH10PAT1_BH10PAT1_6450 [soil metagenome]